MKICYLANSASIHTRRWAQHFSRRGYEVSVISFQPGTIQDVPVFQLTPLTSHRRLSILLNLGQVRRLVRQISPDILHVHYVTSYGLAGVVASRHPLVMTAWGSDVLVEPERSRLYRLIVRFALSHADLITSMAAHMTQHLIQRDYASADKIVTLPFGVDTELFHPNQHGRKHRNTSALVISTRRLDEGLDVHLLIKAIPLILKVYPDTHFIVVGDGPLRASLEQLAMQLGVRDSVDFRGEVPHTQMPALLSQADIFVSTSRSDGNNISLNEAMACGAFPVATDIPANREWIDSRVNGLLFTCLDATALADCVIEALSQPEWCQMAMEQNWEIVRVRASWAVEMAKMEEIYLKLTTGKRN